MYYNNILFDNVIIGKSTLLCNIDITGKKSIQLDQSDFGKGNQKWMANSAFNLKVDSHNIIPILTQSQQALVSRLIHRVLYLTSISSGSSLFNFCVTQIYFF